jgi:hypothetical protein
MAVAGQVIYGTCGWSDQSLVDCGRFYPKSVKTAADKLATYSQTFGCVEVRARAPAAAPRMHARSRRNSVQAA